MTITTDREPTPILALARELHGLLRHACGEGGEYHDSLGLAIAVFKATAMAQDLCDAIEERDIPLAEAMAELTMEQIDEMLMPYRQVPDAEAWLWKNPAALRAVQEGIRQAAAGELVPGPDLDADAGKGMTGYGSVDELFADLEAKFAAIGYTTHRVNRDSLIPVTPASGNVFADLGLPDADRLLAESEAAARAMDLIECDDDLEPENESR